MKRKLKNIINAKEYYKNHKDESTPSIAKKFGIDRSTLQKNLKLKENYEEYIRIDDYDEKFYYYFTSQERDMVLFFVNNPKISFEETKRIFKINVELETFIKWIQIFGYKYTRVRKYNNNKNAFNKIETEEDAYWLGFLTADGYINEDHGFITLTLGEIDLEHLKKFVKYMGFSEEESTQLIKQRYGGAYTRDNLCYSVTICGKQIVDNLKQYGLFQKKSGKEVYYEFNNKDLQKAYVRGLWDGDGYIRSTEYGIGLCGSLDVVTKSRKFVCENANIPEYQNKYIYKDGKIYRLTFGGKNISTKIINFLYKDSTIYLNRKYNLYTTYCRV